MDNNIDSDCGRTTYPEMVLGSNWAWMAPWPPWQTGHPHQSVPYLFCFFRSASFHSTRTLLLLLFSHFSTRYLLSIMTPSCPVLQGSMQASGYLQSAWTVQIQADLWVSFTHLGQEAPGRPVYVLSHPELPNHVSYCLMSYICSIKMKFK